MRYHEDPEWRRDLLHRQMLARMGKPDLMKKQNEHKKERYWNEPEHREEHLARQRNHYKKNKDRILKYKSGMRTAKRRNKRAAMSTCAANANANKN